MVEMIGLRTETSSCNGRLRGGKYKRQCAERHMKVPRLRVSKKAGRELHGFVACSRTCTGGHDSSFWPGLLIS